jgi:hypothetical protein
MIAATQPTFSGGHAWVDLIWTACVIICFMKGKWRMASLCLASIFTCLACVIVALSNEDNGNDQVAVAAMIGALLCGFLSWAVLFGAIRLAYPHSSWALRFYNEANMERARERFRHKLKDPNVIEGQIVAIEGRSPLTLTDVSRTVCHFFCKCVGWPLLVVGMILAWGAEVLAIGMAIYFGRGQGFLVMMGWLIGSGAVLRFGSGALVVLGGFLTGMD